MTTPSPAERDTLFKAFNTAMFRRDMDGVYKAVTPDFVWRLPIGPAAPTARELRNRADLAAYLEERKRLYEDLRYENVVTYHAPDASFNTFQVTGRKRVTGEVVNVHGLERFLFRDGRIMQKDAYWKRIEIE